MHLSNIKKVFFSITQLCTNPGKSLSWVRRGGLLEDRVVIDESYWFLGTLPRKPLSVYFPHTKEVSVIIPRTFDRTFGTSITVTEAVTLAALVRNQNPKKILEIGTFDGNTALLFATNQHEEGRIVTVDLPPDFDPKKDQATLKHAQVKVNVTPRAFVARQYQESAETKKITQVYGDSASLDWSQFGGPFEFIFIDGCHKAVYVRSDTENAMSHLAQNGLLVWHDYGVIPDVTSVVDAFAKTHPELKMFVPEGTRLAVGIRQ